MRISSHLYVCIHSFGTDNTWADLLARWTISLAIHRLLCIPALPITFEDFEWPTTESIRASQKKNATTSPVISTLDNEICQCATSGAFWIPEDDTDLQLRLDIIAQDGTAGHRDRVATTKTLSSNYSRSSLSSDVTLFVTSCIRCLSTMRGDTVPRPFGPSRHGTTTNALLQFGYTEMCNSPTGEKYILMLHDYRSGYSWLYPTDTTSADTAASALIEWCAAFRIPEGVTSDGPSHF